MEESNPRIDHLLLNITANKALAEKNYAARHDLQVERVNLTQARDVELVEIAKFLHMKMGTENFQAFAAQCQKIAQSRIVTTLDVDA